jgi:hypothetical protein
MALEGSQNPETAISPWLVMLQRAGSFTGRGQGRWSSFRKWEDSTIGTSAQQHDHEYAEPMVGRTEFSVTTGTQRGACLDKKEMWTSRPAFRELLEGGNVQGAAMAAICALERGLTRYLMASLPDEADAADALSLVSEAVFKGLPGFRWECPLRACALTLAEHAWLRGPRSLASLVRLPPA